MILLIDQRGKHHEQTKTPNEVKETRQYTPQLSMEQNQMELAYQVDPNTLQMQQNEMPTRSNRRQYSNNLSTYLQQEFSHLINHGSNHSTGSQSPLTDELPRLNPLVEVLLPQISIFLSQIP